MYKLFCPACGAQVEVKSADWVMAVCPYCRSTLLRDADTVRNIGRMSEVIEDHTRIQINTSGQYQGKNFSVIGRIQLRYEDGFWNEWYVLFDDGSAGWLSDGSGQYVFTLPAGKPNRAPGFEQIHPGNTIPWDGTQFTATDVRSAQCVAGEGELPFVVGSGYVARVADFRSGDRFLTLDYSDGDVPQVFLGVATTLEDLKCQLLREADQVEETAGRLKGKASTLECPGCGSGIEYAPSKAEHLICPSCHAEVSATAGQSEVLHKHDELQHVSTSLQLGDVFNDQGVKWRLIGFMRCRETGGESSVWVEYLFFDAQRGFQWLVETDDSWTLTTVLNTLPEKHAGSVRHAGKNYTRQWSYGAEVIYAAGAFNWRVSIGDRTSVTDYMGPEGTLSEEMTAEEVTWSLGRKISAEDVAKACNRPELATSRPAGKTASPLGSMAKVASVILIGLNFTTLFSSGASIIVLGIGLLALWGPIWFGNVDISGD